MTFPACRRRSPPTVPAAGRRSTRRRTTDSKTYPPTGEPGENDVLCPFTRPYGVQPLGRRLPHPGPAEDREGDGPDRLCHHGPRRHVRRDRLLPGLQGGGDQARHRLRGLRHPPGPDPVRQGPRVRRGEPPSGAAVRERGGVPEPVLPGVRRVDGGLLHQAPHRSGAAAPSQRRPHRPERVSRRRDPPAPSERRVRERQKIRPGAGGHLRSGPVLPGAPGPRHPGPADRQPGHPPHPSGDGAAHGLHQRRPLPPQGGRGGPRCAAVHPDRQDHRRREPDALRAPELLPPQRGGDGGPVPGGCL